MLWLILSALSLAAWFYLLFARGRYRRASERLYEAPPPPRWPKVVAVIPARNEAETIAAVIASHRASDYPGDFCIVLVDDASTDDTAAIARAAAPGDRRVDVVSAPPLERGWTGKLWAVNHGVARAKDLAPDAKYVLLTDADIVHAASTLRRLVAKAETEDLTLVSLMARLDARGFWGALLIPAFVYFFQQLYPFPLSNDPQSRVAAAAGGCMLVRRDALEKAGGVAAIKDRLIDDCALAALIKGNARARSRKVAPGFWKERAANMNLEQVPRLAFRGTCSRRRIWLGLAADDVVSLRDNRQLSSIWSMAARSAFTQLNHSRLMLIGAIVGMGIIYLGPPATLVAIAWHTGAGAGAIAAAAFGLMAFSYWPTCRLYRQPAWRAALLPAAAGIYMAMTISSAVGHLRGAGGRWKGRVYP